MTSCIAPEHDPNLTGILHGRINKWTQHLGFLTLAEMARIVEGNHGNDSKEGSKNSVFIAVLQNLIIVYIFIFISLNKTNACMCYIVT